MIALLLPLATAGETVQLYELSPDRCLRLTYEPSGGYVHGGSIARQVAEAWEPTGRFEGVVTEIREIPGEVVLIAWEWEIEGVYPGLTMSRDRGRSWEAVDLFEASRRTGECCVQHADGLRARDAQTLAVRLADYGWIETTDGGQSWVDAPEGPSWEDRSLLVGAGRCSGRAKNGQKLPPASKALQQH